MTLQPLQDDGLHTPSVGVWALRKYELLGYYASLFASSMAGKWDERVYVDLFAGAGRARIKHSPNIIPTSPSISLDVSAPFDKYIFCDVDTHCLGALKKRVARDFPGRRVAFVPGDCNANVPRILSESPRYSKGHTVLTFSFVDPFRLSSLRFTTLSALAARFTDFLVLIPAYMDARRNLSVYLEESTKVVDLFLGLPDWRDRWRVAQPARGNFGAFVADQFGMQMRSLGYRYSGLQDTVLVKYPPKNVSLYRLAFFSHSELGQRFWTQAMQYTQQQLSLF